MWLRDKVIERLRKVKDPETTLDVVSMGLIRDLTVTTQGEVSFTFRPSSPVCPLVFSLAFKVQEAVKGIEEVKGLEMVVTDHRMAEELNLLLNEN